MSILTKQIINCSHTVLYSKGWYERSKHLFADLHKTLSADGFYLNERKEGDTVYYDIENINRLLIGMCERQDETRFDVKTFYIEVQPPKAFKYGYRFTGSEPFDFNLAVAHYCLSIIGMIGKDAWKSDTKPEANVLPLNKD